MRPDQQRTVTVLCVDDHPMFRRALCELIAATPGFTQVGEADCGSQAIGVVDAVEPDLVLMDVRMPGGDGIETARILVERHPDLVVVLTTGDLIASPAGFAEPGPRVTMVRKQDLSPRVLLDLWHGRRTRCGPNWVVVRLA